MKKNNMTIACIGSFISGALTAGVGVYILMKRQTDKKIEDEVSSFKKEYIKRMKNSPEEEVEEEEEEDNSSSKSYIMKTSLDNGPVDAPKVEYHKIVANYKKTEADIFAEENDPVETEHPTDESDSAASDMLIRFISLEEYEDDLEDKDENPIDKVSFTWYVEDDILSDDFDDVVENRDALLGGLLDKKTWEEIIEDDGYPTDIFIRNPLVHNDYKIEVITNLTYESAVIDVT